MYDPIETDISKQYLDKLKEKASHLKFAVIGGWGVFFHVDSEYQRAFGRDYIKSRDIDVFIASKDEEKFLEIITGLGFEPSSYAFRYELIYDREEKKIISTKEAKSKHIFNLAYIFLDVFSDAETKKLGAWAFPALKHSTILKVNDYPVLEINALLELKMNSFFEREKLDKELKDACDIFALLFYSGNKIISTILLKKTIEKIISRHDLQEYIAENVLGDIFKASLVVGMLRKMNS